MTPLQAMWLLPEPNSAFFEIGHRYTEDGAQPVITYHRQAFIEEQMHNMVFEGVFSRWYEDEYIDLLYMMSFP